MPENDNENPFSNSGFTPSDDEVVVLEDQNDPDDEDQAEADVVEEGNDEPKPENVVTRLGKDYEVTPERGHRLI